MSTRQERMAKHNKALNKFLDGVQTEEERQAEIYKNNPRYKPDNMSMEEWKKGLNKVLLSEDKENRKVNRQSDKYGRQARKSRTFTRDNGVDAEGNTSESSHVMATETFDEGKTWQSFPTIFPNEGNKNSRDPKDWTDFGDDHKAAYEEAQRRGEAYDFGTNKDKALAFGEGSWKPKGEEYTSNTGNKPPKTETSTIKGTEGVVLDEVEIKENTTTAPTNKDSKYNYDTSMGSYNKEYDKNKIKELQKKLDFKGDDLDGMYGPITHAANQKSFKSEIESEIEPEIEPEIIDTGDFDFVGDNPTGVLAPTAEEMDVIPEEPFVGEIKTKMDIEGNSVDMNVEDFMNTKDFVKGASGTGVTDAGKGAAIGTIVGAAGSTLSSLVNLGVTLSSNDKEPSNPFAGYADRAMRKLDESKQFAGRNKDLQMQDLLLSENTARASNRNSARGINTMRALDLGSHIAGMGAERKINQDYNTTMQGIMGQEASTLLNADGVVMGAEERRNDRVQANKDNYRSNLSSNITDFGNMFQNMGKISNQQESDRIGASMIAKSGRYGTPAEYAELLEYRKNDGK